MTSPISALLGERVLVEPHGKKFIVTTLRPRRRKKSSQAQKIRQHMYEINAESQSTTSADAAKRSEDWRKKAERYKDKADEIEKEARALVSEAEKHMDESHHVHHRADRFDYGELGIELALVLCSVAVLTKQRGFWFAGIVSAVVGACVAGSAFLMH